MRYLVDFAVSNMALLEGEKLNLTPKEPFDAIAKMQKSGNWCGGPLLAFGESGTLRHETSFIRKVPLRTATGSFHPGLFGRRKNPKPMSTKKVGQKTDSFLGAALRTCFKPLTTAALTPTNYRT